MTVSFLWPEMAVEGGQCKEYRDQVEPESFEFRLGHPILQAAVCMSACVRVAWWIYCKFVSTAMAGRVNGVEDSRG